MTRCGVAANRDASIGRDRRSTGWQRQDVAAPGGPDSVITVTAVAGRARTQA